MNSNPPPYPAYAPSGVPWLGGIPAHWEVRRLKHLAQVNPSRSEASSALLENSGVAFLPMEKVGTDGNYDASDSRPAAAVWSGFTYFRRGDVLVAKITPCFENGKGACLDALPTTIGFGSTEFHVLRASRFVDCRFLYRLTKLPQFRRLGTDAMEGAAGQQRVPVEFVATFACPLPPLAEQAAIVRFLDYYDRRIQRAIRAKQTLIALLHEQKQAIIQRAVTHGLDPDVPMMDSSAEWLGEVPAHWDVRRSKYAFREVDERSESGTETHLSMSQRLGLVPRELIGERRLISESYIGGKLCQPGDLVLNRLKAHLGVFALAPEAGVISPDYTVLRATHLAYPPFFELLYRTPACREELARRAKGIVVGFWRLYTNDFYDIRVPLPPVIEQQAIVARVNQESSVIEAGVERARRQLNLLREYRTRLIADVVTGRLDVRAAAAALPDDDGDAERADATGDDEAAAEYVDGEPQLEEAGV